MASVNSSHDDDDDGAVDSINITPLVDVLMVVLVMFILTATAQVAGIQINLPRPVPPWRCRSPRPRRSR